MILRELKNSNHLTNVIFITFIFLISFLAFTSNKELNLFSFQNEDKIHHILAFFFLSFFLQISFKSIKANLKFSALSIFALSIEIIQHLIGRSRIDFHDFIASIFGIFLFFIAYKMYKKNYDIIQTKPYKGKTR